MESNSTDKVEWGRQAEAADHLKKMRCRVKHPALKAPYMEMSRSIDVKCANFSISPFENFMNNFFSRPQAGGKASCEWGARSKSIP
jgi:hypothetical protein